MAALRAINVLHLFINEEGFEPSKLSAISYGEYKPVASNDTAEGRTKNKRIDIVLLDSSFYEEQNQATNLPS